MGFFHLDRKVKKATKASNKLPEETLRKMGCKGCSLNKAKLVTPKMEPTGSDEPFLYVIGGAPSVIDDKEGKQFIGKVGSYIDKKFPDEWDYDDIRWGNLLKCSTAGHTIAPAQVSCCSSKIEQDIAETRPWGVLGFGDEPLKKFVGVNSANQWRGRRIPVKINGHVCWYFPVLSPEYLLANQKESKNGKVYDSDWDKAFVFDVQRIEEFYSNFSDDFEAEDYYEEEENYNKNIEFVLGDGGKKQLHKAIEWMEEIAELDFSGIDIEATSIRPYHKNSKILTVAIGTYDKTYAFPIDHPKAWGSLTNVMHKEFKKFLLNSGTKIAHNLNLEQEWFRHNYGDEIIRGTKWGDTMAQGYVLNTQKGMLSLDSLVLEHMGFRLKELAPLDMTNMINEPLEKVLPYNGRDTKYTHRLFEIQKQILELKINKTLLPVYDQHIVTSGTIVRMQATGLVPNKKEVIRHKRSLGCQIQPILKEIQGLPEIRKFRRLKNREFNPRSNTDDLIIVFRDILKRKEIIKAKDNKKKSSSKVSYSTDESVLKSIPKSVSKLPELLLEMRSLEKLKTTYVDSIDGYTYPDGLIHPSYNDKYTNTGRLSCNDPNGQNFPKRKHKGIRSVITVPPGFDLVSADYGQIEARMIAMATQDDKFVESLWHDLDIHMDWAQQFIDADNTWLERVAIKMELDINTVSEKELIKAARFVSKNSWVFPRFFGASDKSCAGYMDISEDLANDLGAVFWEEFRGVKEWQESLMSFHKRHGYVESLTGRRRYAPIAYNEIINTPIQGAASDVVIDSMNRCSDEGFQTCLNVHDDLTFRTPQDETEDFIEDIAGIMCFPEFDFINVPISIEVEVGTNWANQKEYKVFESNKMVRS